MNLGVFKKQVQYLKHNYYNASYYNNYNYYTDYYNVHHILFYLKMLAY